MAGVAGNMELVCASAYTQHGNLAHKPKGTPADYSLSVFGLCEASGRLTLLTIGQPKTPERPLHNLAFLRNHPTKPILYGVTESIQEESSLVAFAVCSVTGIVKELGRVGTCGRSACYISISHDLRHLLVVNYWDSVLASVPIDENGLFRDGDQSALRQSTIPGLNADKERSAHGEDPHSKHRFAESHAHAVVLEPGFGKMCYVPDLGEGCIKEFRFNEVEGTVEFCGVVDSGGREAGPRYLEFHPQMNICYCVNELASTVVVFVVDESTVVEKAFYQDGETKTTDLHSQPTLRKLQEISTLPAAFPKKLNTCGRIAIDPSGQWLLVSNRGHNSIAVYRIGLNADGDGGLGQGGFLTTVGYYHTQGATPRHFKFTHSGRWLISANQDSDTLSVFSFGPDSGDLKLTHKYHVKSPNFVEVHRPKPRRPRGVDWVFSRM